MKHIRTLFFIITISWILYSCRKEYSFENGGLRIVDTTGNTCDIGSMMQADQSTGTAEYAYNSSYDLAHKVSLIELVNTANSSVDNSFAVSHLPGTILIGSDQYFVTGTDEKVTEFHGYEFPEDASSSRFNVKYTYNSAGQLIKRVEEYDFLPGITSYQMDYLYTGGNLTKAEIKVNNGTALQKFVEITYEYDASKTIKNFIYLVAVAPEIFYFQNAIDAGPASINPVRKATTTFLKSNGAQDSTSVTNFVNYTFNAKNQVTSFEVTGGDFTLNSLYSGKKYTFKYECY